MKSEGQPIPDHSRRGLTCWLPSASADLIQERVVAGVQAAKRRGVRFGRPEVLTDEQRARVRRLRDAGHQRV